MPRRQNTAAVKMRRLKKADCEVDFFFIDDVGFPCEVEWGCYRRRAERVNIFLIFPDFLSDVVRRTSPHKSMSRFCLRRQQACHYSCAAGLSTRDGNDFVTNCPQSSNLALAVLIEGATTSASAPRFWKSLFGLKAMRGREIELRTPEAFARPAPRLKFPKCRFP